MDSIPKRLLVDAPQKVHVFLAADQVDDERFHRLRRGACDLERARHLFRQACKRCEQNGQALPLVVAPDEKDAKVIAGVLGTVRCAVEVHPVWNYLVPSAEVALPGPASGVRYGDPSVQLVEDAPCPEKRAGGVREPLRRVSVERAHDRSPVEAARVPAKRRGDWLVDVYDVEAAAAKLRTKLRDRFRGDREIRDGAVGTQRHRASEGDHVVGQRIGLHGAAM